MLLVCNERRRRARRELHCSLLFLLVLLLSVLPSSRSTNIYWLRRVRVVYDWSGVKFILVHVCLEQHNSSRWSLFPPLLLSRLAFTFSLPIYRSIITLTSCKETKIYHVIIVVDSVRRGRPVDSPCSVQLSTLPEHIEWFRFRRIDRIDVDWCIKCGDDSTRRCHCWGQCRILTTVGRWIGHDGVVAVGRNWWIVISNKKGVCSQTISRTVVSNKGLRPVSEPVPDDVRCKVKVVLVGV
jgi:hypothetical protein